MRENLSQVEHLRLQRKDLILELINQGKTQSQVARDMNISRQAVSQIINRDKHSARMKLRYALKVGKVRKINICENCKTQPSIHAHHEKYWHPYEVRWLCQSCHMKAH